MSWDVELLSHSIKPSRQRSSMLAPALMSLARELSMKTPRVLVAFMTVALPFGTFGSPAWAEPHARLAQSEVTIPSNAQINTMEQQAITTPPLNDSEGVLQGSQGAQIRQMDRRAHRIDEKLLKDDGVCDGC